MKSDASFFKGCPFKNTMVDGYSAIAPNNDDIDNDTNKNKNNNDGIQHSKMKEKIKEYKINARVH